eukprot:SAG31_NODE_5854_length_2293_cov_1.420237_2_plen_146_part_00
MQAARERTWVAMTKAKHEFANDPRVVFTWAHSGKVAVQHFLHHTWLGFKLLAAETRMAAKILLRLLQGKTIVRRERVMLHRVVTDLLRMVPFSFFILVPAMELLLPVALYLFPNMLPSQFEDKMEKEEKMRRYVLGHFLFALTHL